MDAKLILFSLILLITALVSSTLFAISSSQENPTYNTIYIRDYNTNTYELESKFKNHPTSGSYDSHYAKVLYKVLEKRNEAKDRIRVEQKKKEKEWFLE